MGGDRGSVCPTVGPGAPFVPQWDQIHPHLLSPSFLLLSCLSPASPSRSISVLVSLPRAPWALTPAVSPAPPGAEGPAPTPRGRHHHRRSLERVPGNGARCSQVTSVLLSTPLSMTPCLCVPSSVCCYVRVSGLSVCLPAHPVGLEPLSSPNRDGGDVGDETPLSLWGWWWVISMSSPLALSPQARRTYRRYFRSTASTNLANFIYRRLVSGAGGEGATVPSQPPALGLDAPVLC